MDTSVAVFGISELFSTLVKAAFIIVLILIVNKFMNNNPDAKKYQYGKRTQQKNSSFSWDKPKRKSIFSIFSRSKEVNCDLDERIFGPKNQHKDLF